LSNLDKFPAMILENIIKAALLTLFLYSHCFSQILPALPQTCDIITTLPETKNYIVKTVGPFNRDYSDLQKAINEAKSGTILVLDAGAEFKGSYNLPKKDGNEWIIIRSSEVGLLPPPNFRIDPSYSKHMPKIITTNKSGIPAIYTSHQAHHYRFIGIEITADTSVLNNYGLVLLGGGYNSSIQNDTLLEPYQFIIDQCYIHGHSKADIMKFGVRLDCKEAAIINSYVSDFHSVGFDAQAISGINGSGPFKIINNYLEASGENILFGGAPAEIKNLVPSNIEILNNYLYKPLQWRTDHPNYQGKHWMIKNLFELKTGRKILFEGNILENSWADLPIGQSGYAMVLTVRNENGQSPQADVSDVTIRNNIIRHCGAGISISGKDDNAYPSNTSMRILIENNLFEDINGEKFGDLNIYGPNDGIFIKQGKPKDIIINHNTVFQTGAISWLYDTCTSIKITNNIFNCTLSKGGYQGIYGPGFARGGSKVIERYLPNVKDNLYNFNSNVFISGDSLNYLPLTMLSKNYFPVQSQSVGFVDYPNGSNNYLNYALRQDSKYHGRGSDNKDIGVDFPKLMNTILKPVFDCVQTATYSLRKNVTFEIFQNNSELEIHANYDSYTLEIRNLNGIIVARTSFLGDIFKIEAPHDTGIYLATLRNSLNIATKKIFILRPN